MAGSQLLGKPRITVPPADSPFVEVPFDAAEKRPAIVTLAALLLIVYAVAELGNFRLLFYGLYPLVLIIVANSLLCVIAYLVFAFGLLGLAHWARKGTLIMLAIHVVLAYGLLFAFHLWQYEQLATFAARHSYLTHRIGETARQFGVTLLTLLPIVIILTRRGVIAAFKRR